MPTRGTLAALRFTLLPEGSPRCAPGHSTARRRFSRKYAYRISAELPLVEAIPSSEGQLESDIGCCGRSERTLRRRVVISQSAAPRPGCSVPWRRPARSVPPASSANAQTRTTTLVQPRSKSAPLSVGRLPSRYLQLGTSFIRNSGRSGRNRPATRSTDRG